MSIRNQQVINLTNFGGRFSRGMDDAAPPNHFIDEKNLEFRHNSVKSRSGFALSESSTGGWDGSVLRVRQFNRVDGTVQKLILDSSFNIWDDTSNFSVPVLTVVDMIDFAVTVMFDRAYISPHDGKVGLPSEFVYVYNSTPGGGASVPARIAAGIAPDSSMQIVLGFLAGQTDLGLHLYSVAYETESGFITPFSVGVQIIQMNFSISGPNLFPYSFQTIPIGPAGTIARHLVMTPKLLTYDGNPETQPWFFMPGGRIDNNTDTTSSGFDFPDSQLITSANYLLFQRAQIPAGCFLTQYAARLIVGGIQPTQVNITNANTVTPGVALVSGAGDPESISQLFGFVICDPGDAGYNIQNAVDLRGILYITKSDRTYATSDNGQEPSSWQISIIDAGIGAEANSISKMVAVTGVSQDIFLVGNRSGLFQFAGAYSPLALTWKILEDWRRINSQFFYRIQVAVDPYDNRIFIVVPLDDSEYPSHLIYGDYKNGLSPDSIRWSIWEFPWEPTSIELLINQTTHAVSVLVGSRDNSIYSYLSTLYHDESDCGNQIIESYGKLGPSTFAQDGEVCHFNALRFRAVGAGNLRLDLFGKDDVVQVLAVPALPLVTNPGRELTRYVNIVSEDLHLKFGIEEIDNYFEVLSIRIAGKVLWSERPAEVYNFNGTLIPTGSCFEFKFLGSITIGNILFISPTLSPSFIYVLNDSAAPVTLN